MNDRSGAATLVIDAEGMTRRLSQYQEWMRVNHYSEETVVERGKLLQRFLGWCADRSLVRPTEITKPIVERYQQFLFHYRKKNGEPLSLPGQRNELAAVKGFFKFMARSNYILYNPASEILLPRLQKRLPKDILTQEEAERILNKTDVETLVGIRDRAILETLYSTGVRRMELVKVRLYDFDPDRGTLTILHGKGRSQRVVPIGERAIAWVEKYLHEVRPRFAVEPDGGYVFLTHFGLPFSACGLAELVRKYIEAAGVEKKGSVHLFRHTMATLMLEGGADVRFVQAMLGHSKLETTMIYTHVSIRKLKEVHAMAHPARLKRELKVDATKERLEYRKKPRA